MQPAHSPMSYRIERVNALLRQEIGSVVADELKDPRISSIVSITRVETSRDLGFAKVYVSVLGSDQEKSDTLRALGSAAGFIHRSIRPNLRMRSVPHLAFYLDEAIERGAEMVAFIDKVIERDREIAAQSDCPPPPQDDSP